MFDSQGGKMKKLVLSLLAALLPLTANAAQDILRFGTMYGVEEAFLNRSLRGVQGDELPWEVGTANGFLTTDGHLKITVTGIVFSDDPSVPKELQGINDEAEFRAVVSCLTDHKGHIVVENVTTHGYPATRSGDSVIDARVRLPNPCVAPVIFVISGDENHWFAVTGAGD
jgi:hypothetical protein